jgi:hypothetical protein
MTPDPRRWWLPLLVDIEVIRERDTRVGRMALSCADPSGDVIPRWGSNPVVRSNCCQLTWTGYNEVRVFSDDRIGGDRSTVAGNPALSALDSLVIMRVTDGVPLLDEQFRAHVETIMYVAVGLGDE